MKRKVVLSALAILLSFSIYTQSFISAEKQWNVRLTGWGGAYYTEIYIIEGDTTINSMDYNKIWASYDSTFSWQYQGGLREDSNMDYYIPPNGIEGFLYDFNLEIGDVTYVNNVFCSNIPITVVGIDTVEYFGISRKRWLLGENGYVQEYWVEGIGSMYGPLYTKYEYCIICPAWELLCFHNNDILEYMMYGQNGCYLSPPVGIEAVSQKNEVIIRPNPVGKGSPIEIEMNIIPIQVDIINVSGVLVQRLNSIQSKHIKIESNDLEAGFYFIKITDQENKITTMKILIQ